MFNYVDVSQSLNEQPLNAANPVDFKKIYDASMQMLFKISFRIVNDEEAADPFKRFIDPVRLYAQEETKRTCAWLRSHR